MERKILQLFVYNEELKFNEIEKKLQSRSNKISYHLSNMIKNGVLQKKNNVYSLSESSEYLIPYISDKQSILPIILICIGDKNKCFLIKREKKPFQNKLSLPGGRILIEESIEDAVKRIMKEKFKINAKLSQTHSVSIEKVKEKKTTIHSFLIIFVSAKTKDKISLTDVKAKKSQIITSDYKLITEDLSKKTKIRKIKTKK